MPTAAPHPVSHPAITLRIPDACRATGIGRSKLYELIKLGEIDSIKIGRITLIPVTSIERLIARSGAAVIPDERERERQIMSMHPFLANAVITAALAHMTDQVRGGLNSADQLTRSKAEDGLAARIVETLLEAG
ncbi:helix-turn-helix domain-containing protein [Hephaestia mangrovi]|uniref:helix-turn-helix domain-containing protein n=1 Tax=Hephaestia mangrovi TaxID=2873268 RepID=UPI001CA67749|nr:helix-turn-helix domain-containing protein [Hephaestia mangrovi]